MTALLVVVAVGLGTYLLRVSMLLVASRVAIPALLQRAAPFAVVTSFAALAATSIANRALAGTDVVGPLLAMTAGAVAVRRTGSPPAALLAGMPVLWLAAALGH